MYFEQAEANKVIHRAGCDLLDYFLSVEGLVEFMKFFSVAIDGPAGSGKSTVARILAKKLRFMYLDSGAMYRAIAWRSLNEKIDMKDSTVFRNLVQSTQFEIVPDGLLVNGENIDGVLRTPEVSRFASEVAKNPIVREILVKKQQEIAKDHHVIMDGRDIGTVVLPDADVKIFLTASIDERAQRRHHEFKQKGLEVDFQQLRDEIRKRDENDQRRSISPLRQAEDAIRIDTTGRSIEEIVEQILSICCTKMGGEE